MKIQQNQNKSVKITCFLTREDERVYFFEPLEKEISVEDMQKIVDANEKLVKGIFNAGITTNKEDR